MNCSGLAFTGSPLAIVIVAASVCLAVGLLLLVVARRRRGVAAIVLILLVNVVLAVGLSGGSSARAASTCSPATSAVSISQIAPVTGIAPGAAASPVLGVITNKTDQPVYVVAVSVGITSVTKAAGSAAGSCAPSDFVVFNATARVNKLLTAHGSATFSGASIGFNDKSSAQDACKGATLKLTYVAT